jgi:DeoR/GlpR family transcriptional regulator of sugar metabolism
MGSLDEFDVVIVDSATPPRTIERLRARGINLVVAAPNGNADDTKSDL